MPAAIFWSYGRCWVVLGANMVDLGPQHDPPNRPQIDDFSYVILAYPKSQKNQPLPHQITIFPILGGPKIKENRYPEVSYFPCLFQDPKKSILVGPRNHLGSILPPTWTQLDSNMAPKRTPKSIKKLRRSNLGSSEASQCA